VQLLLLDAVNSTAHQCYHCAVLAAHLLVQVCLLLLRAAL
jgi:hypothetical protein